MSDDDINKPGGPDDDKDREDLDYDDEDSGIFRRKGVSKRLSSSLYSDDFSGTPDEVKAYIERRLQLQNVYNVRKEMRDSFRNFAERNQWLGGVLGINFVSPTTAQRISEEEQSMKFLSIRKTAVRNQDPNVALLEADYTRREIEKDPKVMNAEEYAKYIAGKKRHLLKEGKYKKWRDAMLGLRNRFKSDPEMHAFYRIIRYEACSAFTRVLLEENPDKIAEGLMYLGGIELFDAEDLLDVPKEIFELEHIRERLIALLEELIPGYYLGVRTHLVKLGFFQSYSDIDHHLRIVVKVKEILEDALNRDAAVFAEYRESFIKGGMELKFSERDEKHFKEKLLRKLRIAAAKSPGKYLAERNHLDMLNVMDAEEADADPQTRWYLLGHKLQWGSIHPWALSKMERLWRFCGLSVMDDVSTDEFENQEDSELQGSPLKAVTIDYMPLTNKNFSTEVIADMSAHFCQAEKELYEQMEEETKKLSQDYLDYAAGEIYKLQSRFPQYDGMNGGKGYMAHIIR